MTEQSVDICGYLQSVARLPHLLSYMLFMLSVSVSHVIKLKYTHKFWPFYAVLARKSLIDYFM